MNETLRTIDGRHVLRLERRLAHTPAKVWRALTEAPGPPSRPSAARPRPPSRSPPPRPRSSPRSNHRMSSSTGGDTTAALPPASAGSSPPAPAARLVLTQTGPQALADRAAPALAAWRAHLEGLAAAVP